MVPWWSIPVAAWASAAITLAAYAIVKVGGDSERGQDTQDEGGKMTYALCDNLECMHHDGDGCTLEAVSLQAQYDSTLCCLDCEPSEEGDGE